MGFRVTKIAGISMLLLCALTADALAQDDGGMSFGVEEVEEEEEEKVEKRSNAKIEAFLKEGKKLYKQEKYEESALLFYKVLQDEEASAEPYHPEAQYELGKTLMRLKLYQGALRYYGNIVDEGEEHPYFLPTLRGLLLLTEIIPGNALLTDYLAAYYERFPRDVPERFRDAYAYLVGRHFYKTLDYNKAQDLLGFVSRRSDRYTRSQYILGIVHVANYDAKKAVASFKNVLRVLETKKREDELEEREEKLYELTQLAMARVFYSTGSYDTSLKYYAKIPRKSNNWLNVLFETSWAYFQIDRYNKALGNLLTLNSPFFRDAYFPEGPILAGVIYFYNCKYKRVRDVLEDFKEEYEPLIGTITELREQKQDPLMMLQFFQDIQKGEVDLDDRLRRIVAAAREDRQLQAKIDLIGTIQREQKRYENLSSSFRDTELGKFLKNTLQQELGVAQGEAGTRIDQRLASVVDDLRGLSTQRKEILFEVTRAEKGEIEADLRAGMVLEANETDDPSVDISDEELYWTFDGEYWKDELGYYVFSLNTECKR
jgi:tetratricopeptide (TPR) repeat protein